MHRITGHTYLKLVLVDFATFTGQDSHTYPQFVQPHPNSYTYPKLVLVDFATCTG